jgi:hypothetical protein
VVVSDKTKVVDEEKDTDILRVMRGERTGMVR